MNKKIHKKITKLEKFLHIDQFVKKTDLKKLIKANPLNQAKKSINKFYQDYKKIKEREDIKREKKNWARETKDNSRRKKINPKRKITTRKKWKNKNCTERKTYKR